MRGDTARGKMGVKELWKVLGPVGKKTSLYELSDKTIAVDLSCWVCENQIVGEKYVPMQAGMHLRNIFFRTSMLLLMNVTPVFVLDGKPPDLKSDTLEKRKQMRYKHGKESTDKGPKSGKAGNRSRLKFLLKQCKNMLEMMGLTCLESDGEGEALCAQLNKEGIVDGVVTQDSDVFLYGAKVVYRNFNIQGTNGSVEIFKMEDIEKELKLTLEKLIAMSLLCGCDYDDHGVVGVGKERALKFLSSFKDGKILDRLRQWRINKTLDRYDAEKVNCTKCSHAGKLKEHNKQGCGYCGTDRGCIEDESPFSYRNLGESEKAMVNLELFLRKKALENPTFPEEDIIDEFLKFKQAIPKCKMTWRQPRVTSFVQFTSDSLEWELEYAFQKILPLSTRWELLNSSFSDFEPKKILKKKIAKGIPCFEIMWSATSESINALIECCNADSQESQLKKIVTVEPQTLVTENLPALYQDYNCDLEKEKIRKKEEKKKAKPKKDKQKASDKKIKNADHLVDNNIPKIDSILKRMENLTLGTEINLCDSSENSQNAIGSLRFLSENMGEVGCSAEAGLDLSNQVSKISNFDILENMKAYEIHDCSSFNCQICDDSTLDYQVDETLIIESILARKQFY